MTAHHASNWQERYRLRHQNMQTVDIDWLLREFDDVSVETVMLIRVPALNWPFDRFADVTNNVEVASAQ